MPALKFLLEIGTEEIPDWMIEPALADLQRHVEAVLTEHNLGGKVTRVDATPRRLVLFAEKLKEAQPDELKTIAGPPVSAGEGAAQGFARKMGIAFTDLEKAQTPKGEYYQFRRSVQGRRTADVLAEALPGVISRIYFPKTMYWTAKSGPRFIRPIRWMVALLGKDIIRFELAGVKPGDRTQGHRRLGKQNIKVSIASYEKQLAKNFVVLAAAERRRTIESGLGAGVVADEALVNTLVYLTEFPATIRGSFDPKYLELPREILSTVMRHHQRYFSVQDENGNLAPEFVAVMNTNADPEGLVRLGNERVLRARFNDAGFFWDTDLKRPLESRLEDLKHVTFQAKLGSYYEKTQRTAALAAELSDGPHVARAVQLLKCDLTTDMVKEFTELQGVVGGLYARQQGEPEEVWRAVYEHYKPEGMEDSIPSTYTGRIVALADKLDTLRGSFAFGMIPTGSKDPFALRRAAQGVVKIIVEGSLRFSLATLSRGDKQLEEFLLDRARYYFKETRGFAYDEINAVLAAGSSDLVDAEQRLEAIRQVRPTENFEPLAASFKRIQNILKQAQWTGNGSLTPSLLEAGPEQDLHDEFTRLRADVDRHRGAQNYKAALEAIASLRPKVDLFFDKVLVNAPDERVRENRLTLLSTLLTEFSAIADFSEIVTQH